jgi:hypothetical protein
MSWLEQPVPTTFQPYITTVTGGSLTMFEIASEANFDEYPSPTLTRIRGNVDLHGTDELNVTSRVALGLLLIHPEQTVATVPNPASSPDADWLWWAAAALEGDTERSGFGHWRRFDVDTRAQRRMTDHRRLVLVVNHGGSATQSMSVIAGFRVLVKV